MAYSSHRGEGARPEISKSNETRSKSAGAQARRVAFANAYIACGMNATQAALDARLTKVRRKAASIGARYAQDEAVRALIAERTERALAPLRMAADEVLAKLAQAVRLNPKRFFRDGRLLPIHELPDEVAECLEAFEVEHQAGKRIGYAVTKIKLGKKLTAIELAMRHFGLFPKEAGQAEDPDEVARAVRERIRQMDELTVPTKKGGKDG